jgi:hypothetical protein
MMHAGSIKRWLRRTEDPETADDKVMLRCPTSQDYGARIGRNSVVCGVPLSHRLISRVPWSLEGTRAAIYVELGACFQDWIPFYRFWA